MVEIVAALIWEGKRFMICQNSAAKKAHPLLWEFVGGKVEPGETKEQAIIRECKEELEITIEVGSVFMEVVHEYPDICIHLTLFNATITAGIPKLIEHNDLRWILPSETSDYEFRPADSSPCWARTNDLCSKVFLRKPLVNLRVSFGSIPKNQQKNNPAFGGLFFCWLPLLGSNQRPCG